jgi:TRAP-type C4-dicarboxylate transport system permease small subunit
MRTVHEAAEWLCAACILAIALVVFYEIVARLVFDAPTTWSQEIAVYLLLALGFLGFAPTLAADEHIRIDMLVRRFRPGARRALEVVIYLSIAAFAAVAAWGGVDMVRQSLRFGRKSLTLLEIPVWIPQLLVPIGLVMLLATALWLAWRQRLPHRDEAADE